MVHEKVSVPNENISLRPHPTDTDGHAAEKILFINEKTKQIVGPKITNGDMVSIKFFQPEIYEFDLANGTSTKFLVSAIEGRIGFTHELYENGYPKQSAPVRIDFTFGQFDAIDPRTGETWVQVFENSNIALRLHTNDVFETIIETT